MNDIKFITLDNGLTILIYSDKTKSTNHVELITFLGGQTKKYIDSKENIRNIHPGTAHLLEHYICENTIKGNLLDNLQNNKVLSANAITYQDKTKMLFDTVYNFKENLQIFLEGIYNIDFNYDKLEKTKYAVYNEIRDAKDDLGRKIYVKKMKGIFNDYIDNLGTKTSVKDINYKYLKKIYNNFYVPKNQFLVLAGSFDEEYVLKQIKEFYDKCYFKYNKKTMSIIDIDKVNKKEICINGDDLNEIIISYKIKTHDMSNYDRYKLDWYLNYFVEINFSKYSTLNENLKKDNIITGDIFSCIYNRSGYAILEISAYTEMKEQFIKEVENTINNFQNFKEELELRKKNSILHLSVRKDNISNYVIPVIDNYIEFNYQYNDTIDFVKGLNYKEYLNTIKKIDFSNYTVLVIRKNK